MFTSKTEKYFHLKACAEGLFCTNIYEPSMITNPTNVSINDYSYLSIVKQNSNFFTDSEVEGAQKSSKIASTYLLSGDIKF